MVEMLYPKLDRAVIITLLNLDGYYENTIFNNIIRVLDTKNIAYILSKRDNDLIISAVIFCDEETSKKYKDISYKYWICVEILKRTETEYITEELIYRPGVDTDDTRRAEMIKCNISESKDIVNRIYRESLNDTNLIYVHRAHGFLRTPKLDEFGKFVAEFDKYGKLYKFYTVSDSMHINEILREASLYNDQTSSPDDKYIDIKFLTYKGMERYI